MLTCSTFLPDVGLLRGTISQPDGIDLVFQVTVLIPKLKRMFPRCKVNVLNWLIGRWTKGLASWLKPIKREKLFRKLKEIAKFIIKIRPQMMHVLKSLYVSQVRNLWGRGVLLAPITSLSEFSRAVQLNAFHLQLLVRYISISRDVLSRISDSRSFISIGFKDTRKPS